MTRAEEIKFREDMYLLQRASQKAVEGTPTHTTFSVMVMVLGAVLDDNRYRQLYQGVIDHIKSFGVIEEPPR